MRRQLIAFAVLLFALTLRRIAARNQMPRAIFRVSGQTAH